MITHVGTVAVYVTDQEAALRFWIDQVGFELKSERPMTDTIRWLEVGPANDATSLVLYPKAIADDWEQRKPSVVFITDDIDSTCERLVSNGLSFSQPLANMAWGKFAAFLDTEGNEFVSAAEGLSMRPVAVPRRFRSGTIRHKRGTPSTRVAHETLVHRARRKRNRVSQHIEGGDTLAG
jgi:lactoylglutathione lyase